jgi:GR25 family glycosyltransferase involved in LPS biosynthesis
MNNILKIWFIGSPDRDIQLYKAKVIRKLSVKYKKLIITKDLPNVIFLCDSTVTTPVSFQGLIIPYEIDFMSIINDYLENIISPPDNKYQELIITKNISNFEVFKPISKSKTTYLDQTIRPNDYFDEIYCVNLKRSLDRWEIVSKKFIREGLTVYRWEGIDKKLSYAKERLKEVENNFKRNGYYDQSYSNGTCAIYLTHWELLKHIRDNTTDDKVLLLEDDITFHKDFAQLFETQVNIIPDNWDIWYLALNQHEQYWNKCSFNPTKQFFRPYENWGMFGVAIRRSILNELIDKFEQRFYNKFSSDAVLVEDFQKTTKYNIYASFPSLIGHAYGKSERCDRMFTEEITKKHITSIYYDPKIYI